MLGAQFLAISLFIPSTQILPTLASLPALEFPCVAGVASTFINTRFTDETILLDLKHLLKEAKQVREHYF